MIEGVESLDVLRGLVLLDILMLRSQTWLKKFNYVFLEWKYRMLTLLNFNALHIQVFR